MHNPFDDAPEPKQKAVSPGIIIEGDFRCMTCGESVEIAEFLPVDKMLGWLCSEGHKSMIENFTLGI
ncbi:hypothetical protein SEA_WOFFORD_85 [Streptomyces phage Wofford]|uniref:Uncharacterized protein n=1 Tax=Streptomyces phage Wofford TaxID=2283267 RepID=A0A345M9V0_9CAUD|nr:hypothetical protein HWB78_gp189 [Streptomyces phage Wollford]AXH67271.1 hypothetical protein SEA_WOFFORD_85 [Streptomyces phage Wollford]